MRLLIPLLCLVSSASFGFELGPVGAFTSSSNTSFTSGFSAVNVSSSTASGFGAGMAAQLPLTDDFDFELWALYVNEGQNYNLSGAVTGTQISNLPYFEFPVFFSYHLISGLMSIHAGGYFSLATGTSNTTTTLSAPISQISTQSNLNSINDYGAVGGLEFKFNLTDSMDFLISADYFYGMTDLNGGAAGTTATNNRTIQGTAGFLFQTK